MLVCPLEGSIIFSKCPVASCMWYSGTGSCSHGSQKPSSRVGQDDISKNSLSPEAREEQNNTYHRIIHYVTVGSFLESKSDKDLTSMSVRDFPSQEVFTAWCKEKGVKGHRDIPYETIVEHIKQEL